MRSNTFLVGKVILFSLHTSVLLLFSKTYVLNRFMILKKGRAAFCMCIEVYSYPLSQKSRGALSQIGYSYIISLFPIVIPVPELEVNIFLFLQKKLI